MGTTFTPGGTVFYDKSANVTVKEVTVLYLNLPPPVRGVHLRIDPFTIRIQFVPRQVDQVILLCYLAKEISYTIQDITIEELQSSLAILNLFFEPLQIRTVRIQRPEVVPQHMYGAIADSRRSTEATRAIFIYS